MSFCKTSSEVTVVCPIIYIKERYTAETSTLMRLRELCMK